MELRQNSSPRSGGRGSREVGCDQHVCSPDGGEGSDCGGQGANSDPAAAPAPRPPPAAASPARPVSPRLLLTLSSHGSTALHGPQVSSDSNTGLLACGETYVTKFTVFTAFKRTEEWHSLPNTVVWPPPPSIHRPFRFSPTETVP